MSFLNPWALLGLLSVPALITLYILKQKHKPQTVPSLMLWKRTRVFMEATTPFQKLRRNLLFFLQLLAVILLSLALANPAFNSSETYDETIVVIDASASMRAVEDGSSRYEKAVKECTDIAGSLHKGQKMTLIFAGSTVYPAVSHSENRHEIISALKSAECGYAGSDIENAILLADSLRTDAGNCRILVYTDYSAKSDNTSLEYRNMASSRDNIAVLTLKTGYNGQTLMALSTVESFSSDREVTLELYADGKLCDARTLELKAGELASVYWKSIPEDAALLTVKLPGGDILSEDDSLSAPVNREAEKSIMVVSESGFFWEKVLSAVSAYKIFKCVPEDYSAADAGSYDLIIFDGWSPSELPENAALWFISPEGGACGLQFGDLIKGSSLTAAGTSLSDELCSYVTPSAVSVSQFYELTSCEGWTCALKCGTYPALIGKTDENGRQLMLFTFDIHDSNLPLLKDFPILIQNMLTYSLPVLTDGDGVFETGSLVTLHKLSYATAVSVLCPDGTVTAPGDDGILTLKLPGLYTVTQTTERQSGGDTVKGTVTGYVVSSIPASESAMEAASGTEIDGDSGEYRGQFALRPFLLLAVILLLIAEWWVYNREN